MILELIQHQVNDNSCEGDIQPDWEGQAGYFFMLYNAVLETSRQRNYRQRRHKYREKRVRDENTEIDWPEEACSRVVNTAHMGMIVKIRNQKERGCDEGADHYSPVAFAKSQADQDEARHKEDRARGIKNSVDKRERFQGQV